MRNYTTLNYVRANYNFSGPLDPPTASMWFLGVTGEDAIAQANHAAAGSFTIVEFEDQGIWYVLLDKFNVSRLINTATFGRTIGDPFFCKTGGIMAYPANPFRDEPRTVVDGRFIEAPNGPRRTGWTDGDAVARAPQGDEGVAKPAPATGPPGEGQAFVAFLENLQLNMLDAGRINDAAYVQYLLDQYLAAQLSQLDVLTLLRMHHIPR